jgi:signal transduction histidine kinase
LNNSIDAVSDKGRIFIRVSDARERDGQQRPGVRLSVCDNGPGIPGEMRKKLFEPFFTTKRDVGTGLGLWVSSNILRKHEGRIRVRSSVQPGRSWTVFSVFLPVSANVDPAAA